MVEGSIRGRLAMAAAVAVESSKSIATRGCSSLCNHTVVK